MPLPARYVDVCERHLRTELESSQQIRLIRKGLALVVAPELLLTLGPSDLEARVCGRPFVDVAFLRSQTTYSVGLSDTDPHIVFFWNTLSSWPQDNLQKFIKFACNQVRWVAGCAAAAGSGHLRLACGSMNCQRAVALANVSGVTRDSCWFRFSCAGPSAVVSPGRWSDHPRPSVPNEDCTAGTSIPPKPPSHFCLLACTQMSPRSPCGRAR